MENLSCAVNLILKNFNNYTDTEPAYRANFKIIYKNEEEFTSPLEHLFKSNDEYICITNNTIYIISSKTEVRKN